MEKEIIYIDDLVYRVVLEWEKWGKCRQRISENVFCRYCIIIDGYTVPSIGQILIILTNGCF
jgi:hypothetical protein